MKRRLVYIDYLRCIYIILMVVFHLVYIGDKYPGLKQVVYTFHMPAFLLISGYLANVEKRGKDFLRSMAWILVPYVVMEVGYVIMASVLSIREHVDSLSFPLLCRMIFWKPIGPYWYLHTLILCSAVYYLVAKVVSRFGGGAVPLVSFLGLFFWGLSDGLQLMNMGNAVYFLAGVLIRRWHFDFLSVFRPSLWAWLPFLLLCGFTSNLERYSLPGMAITFLSMSAFLGLYGCLSEKVKGMFHFVGRNTLPILLFSPIFTIQAKLLVPLFAFDPTGLCFMVVAVVFVIVGSLFIAWSMDKLCLSRYFCGGEMLHRG